MLAPWSRALDVPLAVALTVAYAVVARVEFAAGAGIVVPTQLVFVPMLLLLPTPLVPLLVAAAYVLSDLGAAMRDRLDVGRAVIAPANAWFAVWPALVLVLGDAQLPSWDHWAVVRARAGGAAGGRRGVAPRCGRGSRWGCGARRDRLRHAARLPRRRAALPRSGCSPPLAPPPQPWAVLLVLPVVALFASFAREREARIDGALELSQAYRGTALLLGDVIEADDQYTGDHTKDVVELTVQVADALGVDAETSRGAEFGALLHDVGKIHIPASIINKPGPLDDDEWVIMKTHTVEGQKMLERVGGMLARVGVVVRASHERWDGGGYPDGLAGEDIPLAARIVSASATPTTR